MALHRAPPGSEGEATIGGIIRRNALARDGVIPATADVEDAPHNRGQARSYKDFRRSLLPRPERPDTGHALGAGLPCLLLLPGSDAT